FTEKHIYPGVHTSSLDAQHLQRPLRSFDLAAVQTWGQVEVLAAFSTQNHFSMCGSCDEAKWCGRALQNHTRRLSSRVSLPHEIRLHQRKEGHIKTRFVWSKISLTPVTCDT
ncbi:hypothetical protein K443DRAFT_98024, partial [Laccaria amethystina LaAM-08-1]